MVDGPFFDIVRLPLVKGDPAHRAAGGRARSCSRESDGDRAVRRRQPDRPDADRDAPAASGRPPRHRRCSSDLPRNSHMRSSMLDPLRSGQLHRRAARLLHRLGLAGGLGLCRAAARRRPARRSTRQLPAWEKRNIPTRISASANQCRRRAGLSARQRPRRPSRRARRTARDAPGNDRAHHRHLRDRRRAHPRHGLRQLHQPRHRPGQPARAAKSRSGRCSAPRRQQLIVQFLGESMLVAALAMLVALALVELLLRLLLAPSSTPICASPISAAAACCCPILGLVLLVGVAGGLYPAFYLSRFQPAPGAQGQPLGRDRRDRAGCATCSSSPSSRCRSASSSAPRSSTPRPSTRAPPIPAIERDGLIQVAQSERRASVAPVARR